MSMRIFSITNNQRPRWYQRRKSHYRKVLAFLQSMMVELDGDDDRFDNYPWCFVFSTTTPFSKKYYIGALMTSKGNHHKNYLCALFSHLPFNRIKSEFERKFHLAFWQARILAHSQSENSPDINKKDLSQWISALHHSYSPLLESIFIRRSHRFINTCNFLLSNFHIVDYQMSINSGVDFMPWKNWPECVQSGGFIWLWRQSQHGRIIDSKKIPIPEDITNASR